MKRIIILTLFFLALLAIGFIIHQKYNVINHKNDVYDDSGNKIGELFYLNDDTASLFKMIKYYPNGNQKEIAEVKNGLISGYKYYFDSNGIMTQKSEFKEDLPNGYSYFYNSDGSINSKSFWLNGVQCGNVFFYKKDSLLELYNSIDYTGKSFYIVQYDSAQRIQFEEGLSFSSILLIHDKKNNLISIFNTDDPSALSLYDEFLIIVADPPNTKAIIKVSLKNSQNHYAFEAPVINSISGINLESLMPGKYNLSIVGELRNIKSNSLIRKDLLNRIINIDK